MNDLYHFTFYSFMYSHLYKMNSVFWKFLEKKVLGMKQVTGACTE